MLKFKTTQMEKNVMPEFKQLKKQLKNIDVNCTLMCMGYEYNDFKTITIYTTTKQVEEQDVKQLLTHGFKTYNSGPIDVIGKCFVYDKK